MVRSPGKTLILIECKNIRVTGVAGRELTRCSSKLEHDFAEFGAVRI